MVMKIINQWPISYSYKPKKLISIVGFLFFLGGVYCFISMIKTSDQGLQPISVRRILGIFGVSLSSSEVALYYLILAIMSGAMSLLALLSLYEAYTSEAKIILTKKKIFIPSRLFGFQKSLDLPFDEILSWEFID